MSLWTLYDAGELEIRRLSFIENISSLRIGKDFIAGAMDEVKKARRKYLDEIRPEINNAEAALTAARKEQKKSMTCL